MNGYAWKTPTHIQYISSIRLIYILKYLNNRQIVGSLKIKNAHLLILTFVKKRVYALQWHVNKMGFHVYFSQDAYHLRRHRASKHEGPKCHVCVKCGKSFADKYLLTAHEKSESKEGFVKCDQCGLEVRSANDLKEHVKNHMPDKNYRCEECLKTYKHKTNLSRHVRTAHTSVKSAHTS